MRLGVHLSAAGGPLKALAEARSLGLTCLQLFAGNPRGWTQKPLDPAVAAAFRAGAAGEGLDPVVVHAPYLLNLASPDDALREKSAAALAGQLARAGQWGCRAVVVHPGSRGGRPAAWGNARVAEAVAAALDRAGPGVAVWLENTAGGGGQVGGALEELAEILARLGGRAVAACLDTAHAWGAGHRLSDAAGVAAFLARVEATLGLGAVALWHLNDSSVPLGSRRDRHTHPGEGGIGRAGFAALMAEPRLAAAPGILETPKDRPEADRRNLDFLRQLGGAFGGQGQKT